MPIISAYCVDQCQVSKNIKVLNDLPCVFMHSNIDVKKSLVEFSLFCW
jgi:hypothetical protein